MTHNYSQITHVFQLVVIGRDGMYTYGRPAATPALARLATGVLHRRPNDLLGINRIPILPGAGNEPPRYGSAILVDAESAPGEWQIGAREA